jgi:hypothetical protein
MLSAQKRGIVSPPDSLAVKQKRNFWQPVSFISVETGDDLIVSFAVYEPDDPVDIESLIVLRTPKYERLLYDWERGASVSFDRGAFTDERLLLREVVYSSADNSIVLRTDRRTYNLDLRKVDSKELAAMCRVFRKMNFDSSIQLTGI